MPTDRRPDFRMLLGQLDAFSRVLERGCDSEHRGHPGLVGNLKIVLDIGEVLVGQVSVGVDNQGCYAR
jgi:hypothetical protein